MNDTKLQEIAKKVITNIKHDKNDKNFGVIITILIIISIILTVIRILQECNKNVWTKWTKREKYTYFGTQIKDKAEKQSWLTKRIIKKAIRKELSRENYQKYGIAIMSALLDTGVVLTDDEISTLAEAANV